MMALRLSAIALACRRLGLACLMVGRHSMVIRLRLHSMHIGLGRSRSIEVVRVNFLLSVGLH